MDRSKVEAAVLAAIEEVNEDLPEGGKIDAGHDAQLFGREGKLDSLGLVNLIVATEQSIEDELGESITLADEKAISQRNSPFRTTGSLIDYVIELLAEESDGE